MTIGGLSEKRLARLRPLLERHVETGFVPGLAVAVRRHGETHVEAAGTLAFEGAGAGVPMARDTIVRIASMTKPIVAACAMTLVEDCTLRLDDPVDDLLPELAGMRVLADPLGPLEKTVPAVRPITLRDLLTFTPGTGMAIAEPGTVPIADALGEVGAPDLDGFLRQLGTLPLVEQPGTRWMYDTSADLTGALIARATGTSLGEALRERVFEPLGMKDSGFSVDPAGLGRFATGYSPSEDRVVADAPDGRFSRPAAFESGGGGLVSTADDYLAFASALLAGGGAMLSRPSVTLMTTDHLTPEQKAVTTLSGFRPDYFRHQGWGFGTAVITRRTGLGPSAGSYGWSGFWGTAWYNDPAEDLSAVVILQRAHMGDQSLPMWNDLWTTIYQAIDD
ncbi:beta-lactamase family protein [Actinoplanes bogorensis]|uniref:Beta-lactamase family protein n=1 Tax=Paractinoplanes bogorensis TaxID=1610840 RepID=A0ABS5YPW0_9ACTN|nr:serine hydrolase domain-containing protein [Actinoplanes bogorensis]MBU2665408.1 beta-lactamase family protein [Actinoplanes bogorensis]